MLEIEGALWKKKDLRRMKAAAAALPPCFVPSLSILSCQRIQEIALKYFTCTCVQEMKANMLWKPPSSLEGIT